MKKSVINAVNSLSSIEECHELWDLVKIKHKQLQDFENAKSKSSLFVGAVVEVDSPKVKNPGKIIKINRSKAKVEVDDMIWNVPLGMLKVVA